MRLIIWFRYAWAELMIIATYGRSRGAASKRHSMQKPKIGSKRKCAAWSAAAISTFQRLNEKSRKIGPRLITATLESRDERLRLRHDIPIVFLHEALAFDVETDELTWA